MFGFLIDFNLRVIGPQVAFAAGLGLACLGYRKIMTHMTCRAASLGPVRIQASHAGVRPCGRIELAVRVNLYFGAMALPTPIYSSGRNAFGEGRRVHRVIALNHFTYHIVYGSQLCGRLAMMEFITLPFFGMASSAVKRRH